MKIILLILTVCIFYLDFSAVAQTPNWQWAKGVTGARNTSGKTIATDMNNNVLVTGFFDDSVIKFENYKLINNGREAGFLVKYNSTGNVIWARGTNGISDNEEGISVCSDRNDNIYCTGIFYDSLIIFGNDTLINSGNLNTFLVKYDSLGNVIWARSPNGSHDNIGVTGITVDAVGNTYMVGEFTESIIFNSDTLTTTGMSVFIAKYDSVGNSVWAKSAGGTFINEATGVHIDANNNIYLTGFFQSPSIIFGNTTLTNNNNNGSGRIFTVKYDSEGNVIWAKGSKGPSDECIGWGICTDASGNIYVTGELSSPGATFGNYVLTSNGSNTFLVKYDVAGDVVWAESSAGADEDDEGSAVSTDMTGNIYITGSFDEAYLSFGAATIRNANQGIGNEGPDIFIVKYDSMGNVLWAKSAGGDAVDEGKSVSCDKGNNIYITGPFNSAQLAFGGDTLYCPLYDHSGVFVAKIGNVVTGIEDPDKQSSEIRVYPNPSMGNFTFIGIKNGDELEVYNVLGELIYKGGSQKNIDLSQQKKGVYFYRIGSLNNGFKQGKIVVN